MPNRYGCYITCLGVFRDDVGSRKSEEARGMVGWAKEKKKAGVFDGWKVQCGHESGRQLPEWMTLLNKSGLYVAFDDGGMREYCGHRERFDEIFRYTFECHKHPIQTMGQVPIWIHGADSPHWKHGYSCKKKEGVELGDAKRGIAFFGNMTYKSRDSSAIHDRNATIFIIGTQAILNHPTVFVHEMTHAFHYLCITKNVTNGPKVSCLGLIKRAFQRAKANEDHIVQRFKSEIWNLRQFHASFANENEFLAYCTEAYHSKPRNYSNHSIVYHAPAFPRTRAGLIALDREFNLGILEAIETMLGLNSKSDLNH